MQHRRLIAALSSAALTAGFLAGGPTPASAADLGTITVSYQGSPGDTTLSVDQLVGSVGDNFIVANNFSGTDLEIVSGSAAISDDGTDCTGGRTCPVEAGKQGTFTIGTPGTFQIVPVVGSGLSTRTVSIVASEQATQTPPVTMTFDGNGGNCSSNPLEISGRGGATYDLPGGGSGAGECQRDNYTLLGWSHQQDATSVDPNLTPVATVTFANAGGTMYAVWQADESFAEITYDSNMAATDQCWDSDGNNVPWATRVAPSFATGQVFVSDRETTVLESSSEAPASRAVCKPPFAVLASWNTKSDGSGTIYALDQPLGEVGKSLRLYAQWGLPQVTVSYEAFSQADQGGPRLVSNGQPIRLGAAGQEFVSTVTLNVSDRLGRPARHTLVAVETQAPMLINGSETFLWANTGSSSSGTYDLTLNWSFGSTSSYSLITWTANDDPDSAGVPNYLVFPIVAVSYSSEYKEVSEDSLGG